MSPQPGPSTVQTDPRPPDNWSIATKRPPAGCYIDIIKLARRTNTTTKTHTHIYIHLNLIVSVTFQLTEINQVKLDSPQLHLSTELTDWLVYDHNLLHWIEAESKESHESLRSWICLRITGTPSAEVFLWTASPRVRSIFSWISLSWRAASKAYRQMGRNRHKLSQV